jgi:hydroxypyruvate isomerase
LINSTPKGITMYQLSANIELLFTEAGPDHADRVRAAAAAGFDAVEMWGTFEKDLDTLGAALRDTGVALTSVLAEPRTNFTLPWETDRTPFLDGLARGVENARLLGSPRIVVGSGIGFPGMKRVQNLQKLIDAYGMAVERIQGSGVTIILEPVNSRVDHPGTLVDRTADAVTVAEAVNDDSFKILYDLYHSVTEGEDPATELKNAGSLIGYVQFADVVGRGEPGSGSIDWPAALAILRDANYDAPIGLEYLPTQPTTESVKYIRSVNSAL